MSRPVAQIVRPDRRIAAKVETLAFLFDVSPETIRRAVEAGKLKPSRALGPPLYRVDDVEKLLFGRDSLESATASLPEDEDPSVKGAREAFGGKKAARGRRATAA